MDGKVLGIERRRRWSKDEKSRIVKETLMPGAVVARSLDGTGWRRACSSHGEGWRARRTGQERRRDLLPVEIGAMAAPSDGGGETVAPGDERTPNKVRRHRNRTRSQIRCTSTSTVVANRTSDRVTDRYGTISMIRNRYAAPTSPAASG